MNITNNIIKKIKSKNKDLEGIYVAVDDMGNIIGFDKEEDKLDEQIVTHNAYKLMRKVRLFKLDDIKLRTRIKSLL